MFLQRSRRRSSIGTKVGIAQYKFGVSDRRIRGAETVIRWRGAKQPTKQGIMDANGIGPIQPPNSHGQLLNSIAYKNDLMPNILSYQLLHGF
jgi:hypothetical protein